MKPRLHGAACKTCRRRGRKCTRELPNCQTCVVKGIQCEGYVLKWSGFASRGKLAGQSSMEDMHATAISKRKRTFPSLPLEPTIEISSTDDLPPVDETYTTVVDPLDTVQNFLDAADISAVDAFSMFPLAMSPPTDHTDFAENYPDTTDITDGYLPENLLLSTENTEDIIEAAGTSSRHSNGDEGVVQPYRKHDMPGSTVWRSLDLYNIPWELKYLLNYHILEVAPRLCIDNTTMRNPYSQYILPLAVHNPALLYACAALAACHFNVRLLDPGFHVQALRFKGKAMRRLQEQLWMEPSATDDGKLATILMLTLTDLCLGGYSNFDAHFSAARRLIDLRGGQMTPDSFVEQYIACLDIMSAASGQRKPKFTSADVLRLRGSSIEWSYDVFPCPPDQFEIVAMAVELHKSLSDSKNSSVEVQAQALQLKQRLFMLSLYNERGEDWLHLTEAYRHAIALYIIRLFDLNADEDEISWLTQSVFYHAKSIPALTGWADNLLWPLFHAGLELTDERRRQWLRDRALLMQRSGGFKNVDSVMTILENVWSSETRPDYLTLLSSEGLGSMIPV